MTIEEIKKLLAKIDDGDNQDVHEAILKAFAELDEQLSDITEAHKQVMEERCAPDEHHCTCVPFLRQRIAELEKQVNGLIEFAEDCLVYVPDYFRENLKMDDEFNALKK